MILSIIGPSGCGKSTVAAELVRRGLIHLSPTYTDRPKRAGETEAEHRFVDAADFGRLQAAKTFLRVVTPFGLPYRYGLPVLEQRPGKVTAVLVRAPYVAILREFYPQALCYQIEAPYDFAARAVRRRGGDLGERLAGFDQERALGRQIADEIFVNSGTNLDELASDIAAALART